MALINGGSAASELQISQGGARVLLYDASGNPIYKTNLSAYDPETTVGMPMMGQDGDLVRIPRISQDGSFQAYGPQVVFFDAIEGATVNTDRWISTTTTMTITQAVAAGTLFNANSTVTTTTGAMLTSKTLCPLIPIGGCLRYRSRVQASAHFAGNLIEVGFGDPAAATNAQLINGVVIRKDGSGQWLGVACFNNSELLTAAIDNSTFTAAIAAGAYFEVEIHVYVDRAVFWIRTAAGAVVLFENLEFDTTIGTWGTTHLRVMNRTYNSAGTGTAVQMRIAGTHVDMLDRLAHNKPWGEQMTSQFLDGLTNPLTFAQSANWANSAAGTTRTLANTTAAESTLGGILVANSIAGAATDYIMFGYQVPTGYQFNLTGIRIAPPLNGVAAVATTDTVFQYFFATNSTAVSLATASVMRRALPGYHRGAVGLAAGVPFSGNEIDVRFANAIRIASARFLHIGCRVPVGTATATETFTWQVAIDGYFE